MPPTEEALSRWSEMTKRLIELAMRLKARGMRRTAPGDDTRDPVPVPPTDKPA